MKKDSVTVTLSNGQTFEFEVSNICISSEIEQLMRCEILLTDALDTIQEAIRCKSTPSKAIVTDLGWLEI